MPEVATPLFQTSANLVGEPPPSRFDDVPEGSSPGADFAIDGGELTGLPSTVVDVTGLELGGGWKILREGGMPEAEVAQRLVPRSTLARPACLRPSSRLVAKSIRTIFWSRRATTMTTSCVVSIPLEPPTARITVSMA